MATENDIRVWVNPSAWDDPADAERVITAIAESGSDDEAEWVKIAHGDPADILEAATRDWERAADKADDARQVLHEHIRAAHAGGMRKVDIARATGLSRVTVDKVIHS